MAREYAGLTEQQAAELADYEVRAIAFEAFTAARAKDQPIAGLPGPVRAIFEKLRQMFQRIGRAVRSLGFQTAEDVFADAYEGRMAGREAKPRPIGEAASIEGRSRRHGIPASADPAIFSYRNTKPLRAHPDYAAAKSGDSGAAMRLVRDVVKPGTIDQVRARFGRDTIFAAVTAREAGGDNAIPATMATVYAEAVGGVVDDGIVQANRVYHTGAGAMERLLSQPQFAGDVVPGGQYVIVDDVTTLGTTLAAMADHIQANGGKVVGTITLATRTRVRYQVPKPDVIRAIETRFGHAVQDLFGIEPQSLTADEAAYLLTIKNVENLRSRAAAAGQERADRLRQGGHQEDGLAPEGVSRSDDSLFDVRGGLDPDNLSGFIRGTIDADTLAPGQARWAKVQAYLGKTFSKAQRARMADAMDAAIAGDAAAFDGLTVTERADISSRERSRDVTERDRRAVAGECELRGARRTPRSAGSSRGITARRAVGPSGGLKRTHRRGSRGAGLETPRVGRGSEDEPAKLPSGPPRCGDASRSAGFFRTPASRALGLFSKARAFEDCASPARENKDRGGGALAV
jgi:orotate phosphoribosyltransferase